MKIFVGTSGWYYPWNKNKSLDWYTENSRLNAIELNASFYRFPFPSYIKSWVKKGREIRWSIKVNRLITHIYRFNERSYSTWGKFVKLFKPMDKLIDFYLFQLPPKFDIRNIEKLESFFRMTGLKKRIALEVRNISWFDDEFVEWAKKERITWVSIDSPNLPRNIYKSTNIVYLRMHGRTSWYRHNYTEKELKEIAHRILKVSPEISYIYFNNDHNMLENARMMQKILLSM